MNPQQRHESLIDGGMKMTCSHLNLKRIVLPLMRDKLTYRCEDCREKFLAKTLDLKVKAKR